MEKASRSDRKSYDGLNAGALLGKLVMFDYRRTTEKTKGERARESQLYRRQDHRADVIGRVISVGRNEAGEFYFTIENSLIRSKADRRSQPRSYKPAGIMNFRIGTVGADDLLALLAEDLNISPTPEEAAFDAEIDMAMLGPDRVVDPLEIEDPFGRIPTTDTIKKSVETETFHKKVEQDRANPPANITEAAKRLEEAVEAGEEFGSTDSEVRDRIAALIQAFSAGAMPRVPMSAIEWELYHEKTGAEAAAQKLSLAMANVATFLIETHTALEGLKRR